MEGNWKLSTSQSARRSPGRARGGVGGHGRGGQGDGSGDAASYAISAGTLCWRSGRRRGRGRTGRSRRRAGPAESEHAHQIAEGLGYVARDPILRNAVAWSGTANFFVIMVESLGPVFLVRTLHLSPAYVGLMLAAGALRRRRRRPSLRHCWPASVGSARVSWLSMTVFALPGLLIPTAGHGLAEPAVRGRLDLLDVLRHGLRRRADQLPPGTGPPELLGRVNAAARWVTWGTLPLGRRGRRRAGGDDRRAGHVWTTRRRLSVRALALLLAAARPARHPASERAPGNHCQH